MLSERRRGHFEVDIGFTATSNASKETSGSWGFLEGFKGIFLGEIQEDGWITASSVFLLRGGLFKGFFGEETGGEHEIGAGGKGRKVIFGEPENGF